MVNGLARYEFSERLADILGESRRDLRFRVTLMVSGGLVAPGPRGRGSPPATPHYAAHLLIGAMAVSGPAAVLPERGSGTWAALATCMAVGSLAGTLIAAATNLSWRSAGVAVGISTAVQACMLALYAVSGTGVSIVLLFAAFTVGPLVVTSSGIIWTTALQSSLDHGSLARFSSVDQFLSSAAVPVGMILAGIVPTGSVTAIVLVLGSVPVVGLGILAWRSSTPSPLDSDDPPVEADHIPNQAKK